LMPVGGGGSGLVEPRLVKVRAGERGAGWAVGARGVLTARHVVVPFLQGHVDRCLAVPNPAPDAAVFDCTVAWEDEARDLALLEVKEEQVSDWVAAVGPGPGPVLAEPGTAGVSAEAVGYPDASVEDDFPHPELVLGWLTPAGGAVSGRMPFDVDGAVPEDALLWEGMSGAVVRDREFGRLLGVVVQVGEDRQQRRLYVAVLPDPDVDADFAAALTLLGARPVLEASYAPMSRRLLEWFDAAGRPPTAGGNEDLRRVFGVRKARTDIDTQGDPYFPYADRDLDAAITAALDRRVSRDETRVLLLVGEAMTGKSRTGAHALRAHSVLSGWPLLVPKHRSDLQGVVELAPDTGAVLWLDDLNTYAAGLSPGVVRYWQSRPGLVVVATLRTDVLRTLQANPDLRPAWSVVEDMSLVEQFKLPAEWSATEQQGLAEADPSVRQKVTKGTPLGEVLGAAEELRDRLAVADPYEQAVAFAVIDWARTGLTDGIADSQLEQLWTAYLPPRQATVLRSMSSDKRRRTFVAALEWACEPIAGTASMILTRSDDDLLSAEDYLMAQRHTAQGVIPSPVWQEALKTAQAVDDTSYEVLLLGYNAAISGAQDIARAALEPLANSNTEIAPTASIGLGALLAGQGDVAGARAAYQVALDSGNPEWKPTAAYALGLLLEGQGDVAGARAAFQVAIDSGHAEHAPEAAVRLGVLLAGQGDVAGARAAFQKAIDSGHADQSPEAAVNLGVLLAGQRDVVGARAAFQVAIDSGHAEQAPTAAVVVGLLLEQEDVAGARAAYQVAIDSGHAEWAPMAAVNLGLLLDGQGDVVGARAAYQVALDSDHAKWALMADLLLGELETGSEARGQHRDRAAASGDVQVLMSLAELYAADCGIRTARHLLEQVGRGENADAARYLPFLADDPAVAGDVVEVISAGAEAGDTDSMALPGVARIPEW
jgi:tetratricopeptide (TPR) repeat protein